MPRVHIFAVCAAFCFAAIGFGQPADYLPLQVGNQWVYRSAGFGQPLVMEVLESAVFGDNTYYRTRNFLSGDAWLRTRDDGVLVSYDPRTDLESVLAVFGAAEGSTYPTSIDPCNSSAKVLSRGGSTRLPIGQFDDLLTLQYPPSKCADAGLTTEVYAPSIGLAQRTRETIAGPQTYDLYYARIGGVTVVSAPEVTFSLTLDSAVYQTNPALRTIPQVMARLTLRAVQPDPLELSFTTGQEFDLVVTNSAGDVVYRWSDGRAFTQALHSLRVGPGEKNYAVQFSLRDAKGNPFSAGVYTVEASLTTAPQLYRARVAFENRWVGDPAQPGIR